MERQYRFTIHRNDESNEVTALMAHPLLGKEDSAEVGSVLVDLFDIFTAG